MIVVLLFIFSILHTVKGQRIDCKQKCNHHDDKTAFETCLAMCANGHGHSKIPFSDEKSLIKYPPPPFNVTIETEVIISEVKFLESVIRWEFGPSAQRTGFYLRMTASYEWCERDFPGYYASNISPMENVHIIPVQTTDGQPLEIQHGCLYEIEMHSKPYPYGDSAYTVNLGYTVPDCINNYCDCRSQKQVPKPRNVRVSTHADERGVKAEVKWTYPRIANANHQFRFDLRERFRYNNIHFQDVDALRYRSIDMRHTVFVKENQTKFSTILPAYLIPEEEYKLIMFAMNNQLCNSEEIAVIFIASVNNNTAMIVIDSTSSESSLSDPSMVSTEITEIGKTKQGGATKNFSDTGYVKETEIIPSNFVYLDLRPATIVLIFGCLSTGLFICCLGICICRRSRRERKSPIEKSTVIPWAMANSSHSILETNILYRRANAREQKTDYEVPWNRIQVGAVIGQGAFGMVCMGTARGVEGYSGTTTIAIKQLKTNADESEKREFLAEIEIMKQVGRHPNIVAMYGCCTEVNHECMLMEYVPFGDLKHYLQNLRKQLDLAVLNMKSSLYPRECNISPSLPPSLHSSFISNVEDPTTAADLYHLDPNELQSFALQVANGMAHIESLGIIHRDLAARNILVGRSNQLKISDFGLSRHGVYVKTTKGVIPLRWLSIEAIQHNIYSTKSDVWAYGVILWEICTLGGFPYPTISDKDILKYLQQGNRLEKPASCSNQIYDVMMQCWASNSSDRPSFAYLCDHLGDLNSQQSPYVEFFMNNELPPQDGYCILSDNPVIHARPSMLNLPDGENDVSAS